MSLKIARLSIINQLKNIVVATPDNSDTRLYVDIFNDQIERKKEGRGYDYQVPACFVELTTDEGMPIGDGVHAYEITVTLMVETVHYNTENSLDSNSTGIDLVDKIHRKLNRFKPQFCSPLYKFGTQIDHNHDNTNLTVVQYKSSYTDLTGTIVDSEDDTYTEATLQGPLLIINSTIIPSNIDDETGSINGTILISESGQQLITEQNNLTIILE